MPVLIPERTIDSLFAYEFLTVAPTATIWSPHNNRGAGTVDHEIRTSHRYFEVECKTIYRDHPAAPWTVRVRLGQLLSYMAVGKRKLIYLLPAQPTHPNHPWFVECSTDSDFDRLCRACGFPSVHDGNVHIRRMSHRDRRIRHADLEVRLQPWFNHWAWCITAADLTRHIQTTKPRITGGDVLLPADDARLEAIPGAQRLCHLFEEIKTDFVRGLPFGGQPPTDDDRRQESRISITDWTSPLPGEDSSSAQLSAEDDTRVQLWY